MNHYNGPAFPPPYTPPPYHRPDLMAYPAYHESIKNWYRPLRRNANIVFFGLILVFLLGMFLIYPFMAAFDLLVDGLGITSNTLISAIDMLCELLASCLMILIPLTIMRLWIGIPASAAFPMRRPRTSIVLPAVGVCLGVSVLGTFVYAFVASFVKMIFGISPEAPFIPNPVGFGASIIYFVRVVIAPSVLEELMFRGVIMQSLRRFGDMFALVCSSILFSFAHHNLAQGVSGFLVAMTIGFFVLRTGSLKTGILIHFIHNGLLVIFNFITKDMPYSESGVFSSLQLALYIIAGLIGITYLLVAHSRIFSLAPSAYPLPEGMKYRVFFFSAMSVTYVLAVLAVVFLY